MPLMLMRKKGEGVILHSRKLHKDIHIFVHEIIVDGKGRVYLGFEAGDDVNIIRRELIEQGSADVIQQEADTNRQRTTT